MLLNAVFDKTAFLNLRFLITLKENIDETHLKEPKIYKKSIPAYGFKNLKKKIRVPKVSRPLPDVCDFQKANHNLGYGFKNL
jgi:hypothetical protein